MTSNLKVKNYMQETSGAWEGQSKRNWNTVRHLWIGYAGKILE
jgi:hypothetical protein